MRYNSESHLKEVFINFLQMIIDNGIQSALFEILKRKNFKSIKMVKWYILMENAKQSSLQEAMVEKIQLQWFRTKHA